MPQAAEASPREAAQGGAGFEGKQGARLKREKAGRRLIAAAWGDGGGR